MQSLWQDFSQNIDLTIYVKTLFWGGKTISVYLLLHAFHTEGHCKEEDKNTQWGETKFLQPMWQNILTE